MRFTLLVVLTTLIAGVADAAPQPPAADHHIHIWNQQGRVAVERVQDELGSHILTGQELKARTGEDVIAALDEAAIEQGVLLSTAYQFGIPEVDFEDAAAKVREQNAYVVSQAVSHPRRLTAFISFNPLADYALDELEHWAGKSGVAGVKLHLANSDLDLHDDAQVERLAEVFAAANQHDIAVIIHLQTRREDFGEKEMAIFVDRVLPRAPDVTVQIAHYGGNSQFDRAAREAMQALIQAFEDHPARMANVYVDLAAVPIPVALLDEGEKDTREQLATMNEEAFEAARKLGYDRVLFGTDSPTIGINEYWEALAQTEQLDHDALTDLVDDRAPYLD